MLEKLKGIKHIELIVLVLAAGVLIYALYQPSGSQSASGDEARLARILSQVAGAGQVDVFLAYSDEQKQTADYVFASQASTEREVSGVIIIADGADDPGVRLMLMQAAKTALGVDPQRISVFSRGK